MSVISIAISLLVAAIVIYLAISLLTGGGTGTHEETITKPIERGKAVQCLAQRRRVETALQMHQALHGAFPSRLEDLDDLSSDEFYCPVTGSPYNYNARTGKVTCPDHP
jgi:hypothetical protein